MDHARSRSPAQDIHGLRNLVRRHLKDREGIRGGQVRLIHFVDSHELMAYIHGVSEDYVEGFEIGPERALRESSRRADMNSELRLKCEQAIRWLLFHQPFPVIVLPSHGVEIEEEIAYQRQGNMAQDLGLLAAARDQLRALRQTQFAHDWISQLARQAQQGDANSKERLTSFLGHAAPALGAVLNIQPAHLDSVHSRIRQLVKNSRLTTLGAVDWAAFQLTDRQIEDVMRVGLDESRVRRWQRRLEARRGKTERANRLDAEAIAYVERLNECFADGQVPVRGVLATHTGALVHASREAEHEADALLGENDPIRHIRLLAWDLPPQAHGTRPPARAAAHGGASCADDPLGDAVTRLERALDVYNSQIDIRAGEFPAVRAGETTALMEAWDAFETARSTLALAGEPMPVPDMKEDVIGTAEIERLLDWLRNEQEIEVLIADRLKRLVVTFGREVLTSEGIKSLRVQMRTVRARQAGEVLLVPIASRMVGPVQLPAWEGLARIDTPRRALFPNDDLDLSDGTARAYLALALLHATKDSLPLAEVYAKAASDIADFMRQAGIAAESRLVHAQVLRMTSARTKSGDGRKPEDIRARLDHAARLLHEAQDLRASPRIQLERAALGLERVLNLLDSDESARRLFADGLDAVEQAYVGVGDDLIGRMRAAELALAYAVTTFVGARDYGAKGLVTPNFVAHWHRALTSTVDQLRTTEDYLLEELPLVTRALEVIGYSLLHDMRVKAGNQPAVAGECGIPNHLSLDIHAVQRGLNACDDRLCHDLARTLADINARSGSSWTYSFVHAPVWERGDVERATECIADAALRDGIRAANRLLHQVGDDQRILLGESGQIELLQQAKRRYAEVERCLPADITPQVRFLVKMESCYASLLESSHTTDKSEKERLLRDLVDRYQDLKDEFGPRPTLLYRQSIVFGDLDRHEEALQAIQEALACSAEDDALVGRASWMRSAIRRRIGLHFSREAKDQLGQLRLTGASDESKVSYRDTMRKAFLSTFEGFDEEPVDHSIRGKAEMLRRLNNIVFYASLYLQAEGSIESLHEGFSEKRFKSYLERLKSDASAVEREWFYAHTIGAAHHVLRESDLADAAADALLSLLAASGASTQSEAIRVAIEDALSWKRAAAGNDPTRRRHVSGPTLAAGKVEPRRLTPFGSN